jgi:regulator of sirC expression with transglutaminase-like and TPR domain
MPYSEDLIIDAHHGGALLSQDACRTLLQKYTEPEEVQGSRFKVQGSDGDDEAEEFELEPPPEIDQTLFVRAAKPQILARMLVNLKRIYVRMHSFPQARDVTDLLLAVDPSATGELRDRGLLAYHLKDFSAALRDLQAYLQLTVKAELDEDERKDYAQVWEHVKTLRRRVASLN